MSTEVKEDTRKKILKTALRLIQSKSYNSFSFNDIAKEIGIKKASIHYHFASKEILGIAAVHEWRDKVHYLTNKLDLTTNDPWEKLEHYFAFFRSYLKKGLSCPAGTLSAEFNSITSEMQKELKSLYDYYINWLALILTDGKKTGEFHFEKAPIDMALFISSAVEGAIMMARAYNKPNHFVIAEESIIELLSCKITN